MRRYLRIGIIENRRRAALLNSFRQDLECYFAGMRLDPREMTVVESPEAREARVRINMKLDRAYNVMVAAGVPTTTLYSPPAVAGGHPARVDVVLNVFSLHRYQIPQEKVLDIVARAIGVYQADRWGASLRLVNPVFWLALLLDAFVSIPFRVLGRIGFDRQRLESSWFGRLLKIGLYLLPVGIVILLLLMKTGQWELVKTTVLEYLSRVMALIRKA